MRQLSVLASILVISAGAGLAPACSDATGGDTPLDPVDSSSTSDASEADPIDAPTIETPDHYSDFPASPIVDDSLSGTSVSFADGSAAAPCVYEPESDAIYPRNWLRPRFSWKAGADQDVFELRLTVKNQDKPLLVQTAKTSWTMSKEMWTALAAHSNDVDITVEVRGGKRSGTSVTGVSAYASQPMRIAPVEASGSIVYWTTTSKSLKGFAVGDESVVEVLKPAQVQGRSVDCVGCHTSSPDGDYIGTSTKLESPSTDKSTEYSAFVTPIKVGDQGKEPPWLGSAAKTLLAQPLRGTPAFSAAHWATGDRLMITSKSDANPSTSGGALTWIDLEATDASKAGGTLARTGDTGIPLFPTWSHDGKNVVYVSCGQEVDARADLGPADLYSIPFAAKAGGAATKLPGAATAEFEENYPSYSPDDAFIAFTRVPAGGNMLFNDKKEVVVVPAAGGTATRLVANDPPACTGKASPGVYNSFAKWAPSVGKDVAGNRYYWLVFSSKREGSGLNKLYLTPLRVDTTGAVKSFGSIYLWNQPEEDNHTPAWDLFKTPPIK